MPYLTSIQWCWFHVIRTQIETFYHVRMPTFSFFLLNDVRLLTILFFSTEDIVPRFQRCASLSEKQKTELQKNFANARNPFCSTMRDGPGSIPRSNSFNFDQCRSLSAVQRTELQREFSAASNLQTSASASNTRAPSELPAQSSSQPVDNKRYCSRVILLFSIP